MDWITGIWQRVETYRARRRAIAELERYDDWMLADIGITRDQIEAFVNGTLERESQRAGEVVDFAMHRKRPGGLTPAPQGHAA
ncbi:MAG: DUF1127 domain-containing protein [Pseudomonadota bacterium]